MNRIRRFALAGVIVAPLVAGGFIAQERATRDGGRLFGQVLDLVESRYVDSVDAAMLYEKAARGLVSQLQDPYSELFSPRQLTQFNTTTAGRYGGIGMQIEEQNGKGIVVSKVFSHTPAENAGVREGDMIVAVDTVSTRGWPSARVADSLRGTPGSKVGVTFGRPGVNEPIKATFTRAVIHVPAVPYAITFDKVGYIPLQGFNETSTQELAQAVVRLVNKDGARGLVLDLRGNPGGFLDQALAISNLFLKEGQEIASVRGRGQDNQEYFAREKPIAPDIPLVILTDQYTASASEIVAGALQDHDRALILGTTSFGKGLVQTLFNLDGGYALKMTTGKWYTPSGRSIQKERKFTADGQFVEVHPDSLESDSARRARPAYKSDAGRQVLGGGAITPDVFVKPDTFTTAEQAFLRATAPEVAGHLRRPVRLRLGDEGQGRARLQGEPGLAGGALHPPQGQGRGPRPQAVRRGVDVCRSHPRAADRPRRLRRLHRTPPLPRRRRAAAAGHRDPQAWPEPEGPLRPRPAVHPEVDFPA